LRDRRARLSVTACINARRSGISHYVIVRDDAPIGVQIAQTIHAAGWSAQLPGANAAAPPTTAIALAAPVDALAAIARRLDAAGVPHVLVHEPDDPWRGALMAIGVVPSPRAAVQRFVAHLRLVRGKDDHGWPVTDR
jgi:hypothetical protein